MPDDILRTPDGRPTGFIRRAPGGVPRDADAGRPVRTDLSDDDRGDFLMLLNDAENVDLNDFEASFLKSNAGRNRFSPAQRSVIEQMISKYGSKVKGW